MKYNYKNLFASQHEKFMAILGQDYFSSLLVDDDLSDSAIIVSDKRVYQVGRLYESGRRIHGGGLRVSRGKKMVSLQDVIATSSREMSQPLPGSALVVFGAIASTLGLLSEVKQSTIIMLVVALLSVAAGVYLIIRLKKRYMVIEYAGGSMALPVKFITNTELNLFQGIILVEKERVMSGSSDLKECHNCGEKIQLTAKLCRFCGELQKEPVQE